MNKNRILIMGIGNYLMKDEGVGVHAIQYLQKQELPAHVHLLDGGTGGFHLLQYFEKYQVVILIDATLDDNPAGTIRLIHPKYASDYPAAMSTHDIGLKDLVSAIQLLELPVRIHLFVVSIASIQQQGIELSEEVKQAMPDLGKKIVELCGSLKEN